MKLCYGMRTSPEAQQVAESAERTPQTHWVVHVPTMPRSAAGSLRNAGE